MTTSGDPRKRVRVTSPRTGSARRSAPRAGTLEIDEQTRLGSMYMDSLMHAQLRLSLRVLVVVLGGLAMLPALFALLPATRTTIVLGLPLPWLVLGVLVYPVLYAAARYYVRSAERIEASFAELVGRR